MRLSPRVKRRFTKIGLIAGLPLGAVGYVRFVHQPVLAMFTSKKTTLKDEMAALQGSEAVVRSESILAGPDVQRLWEGKSPRGGKAAPPAESSAEGKGPTASGDFESTFGETALWETSPEPVPSSAPITSPTAGAQAGASPSNPAVSGGVDAGVKSAAAAPSPVPASRSEPTVGAVPSGADEAREIAAVEAALQASRSVEAVPEGVSAPPPAKVPEEALRRSATIYASAFNTVKAPPPGRIPPGQVAPSHPPSGRRVATAEAGVEAYLGWGEGERVSLSGRAPSALAGKSVLKATQSLLAVLKHNIVVGSQPVKAVFWVLGPLNNVSAVPPGMTLMGDVTLSPDRRRAMIKIDTCANDDTSAAALPCKGVVRGIGATDDGGEGLTGYYYSPDAWKAAFDGISAWLSTATLSKLNESYSTLGQSQLNQAQATNVYDAMTNSFQRVSESFKASLPSAELRIAGGAMVDILVTESSELWR
jgi:hypothetical protein